MGSAFAEALGIDPARIRRNASVLIECDETAVARIEVMLTPDQLRRITELMCAAPEVATP